MPSLSYTLLHLVHMETFASAFLSFPDKQLFESALWDLGKVKEAECSLFPMNRGPRQDLYLGEPHRVLLHFMFIRYLFGSRMKITEQVILVMGQVVYSQMWLRLSILFMNRLMTYCSLDGI